MPRTAGVSTPQYRQHRASGQAIVTIAGRDHYLGPWKSKTSRIEYDRLIGEWLAAGRPTAPAPSISDLTITEVAIAYVKFAVMFYVKDGKQTTEVDCIKSALRILRKRYGDTSAAMFSPLSLKALQQAMVDEEWSRGFINKQICRLRRAFRWAVSESMIPVTTWQTLTSVTGLKRGKTAARETTPVGPVDDAVVEATLPYLPPVVADMVRLQRLTGCRPGEVCAIRPCNIDTSRKVWSYRPQSHKTQHFGRERRIFIGPKAQDILRPYLLRATDACCFQPRHAEHKGYYDTRTYYHAIQRTVARINRERREQDPNADMVPHWHANQLRHSAATEIRQRFGLEAAQVALGHSNADVTQIYAERDYGLAESVMREVG